MARCVNSNGSPGATQTRTTLSGVSGPGLPQSIYSLTLLYVNYSTVRYRVHAGSVWDSNARDSPPVARVVIDHDLTGIVVGVTLLEPRGTWRDTIRD